VKLSEWAARNGVRYQTAWTWVREGGMPVPVVEAPSGMWLVAEPGPEASGRVVAWCRVSSLSRNRTWTGRWPVSCWVRPGLGWLWARSGLV
jgi:predicted site-specific integrase-resolvase